jgi:hypothetical protein
MARIMSMSGTWPSRMMKMKLVMKMTVDTARTRSVLYLLFCGGAAGLSADDFEGPL